MLALTAVLTVTGICGYAQSTVSSFEIKMTARKYDFAPDTIRVKKGD
jgi:plastocyanin